MNDDVTHVYGPRSIHQPGELREVTGNASENVPDSGEVGGVICRTSRNHRCAYRVSLRC